MANTRNNKRTPQSPKLPLEKNAKKARFTENNVDLLTIVKDKYLRKANTFAERYEKMHESTDSHYVLNKAKEKLKEATNIVETVERGIELHVAFVGGTGAGKSHVINTIVNLSDNTVEACEGLLQQGGRMRQVLPSSSDATTSGSGDRHKFFGCTVFPFKLSYHDRVQLTVYWNSCEEYAALADGKPDKEKCQESDDSYEQTKQFLKEMSTPIELVYEAPIDTTVEKAIETCQVEIQKITQHPHVYGVQYVHIQGPFAMLNQTVKLVIYDVCTTRD